MLSQSDDIIILSCRMKTPKRRISWKKQMIKVKPKVMVARNSDMDQQEKFNRIKNDGFQKIIKMKPWLHDYHVSLETGCK